MIADAGGRSSAKTLSDVRKPAASSPAIGGTAGREPVASRTKRVRSVSPPTRTAWGPASVAGSPTRTSTPSARKRSGSSSVRAMRSCTAWMRAQTAARSTSGAAAPTPYSPAVRTWWATFALAMSVLEGTHPVHRQSPPTRSRSTTQTRTPSVAANSAATMPPDPIPTMIRS